MTLDVFDKHRLPATWEWRKLGDICDVADRDHRTPAYQDDGVPLISPRDFTERGIDLSRLKRVAPGELDAFRKKCKPAKGDILYSRIGTIGEARLVDFELDFVALHSIAMIKPRASNLSSKYLLYLLQSPAIRSQAKHNIKSVGTPDLGLQRIKNFDVPLAPPAVQVALVAELEKQLSRLDEAVANLKRVKANLKRYKAAVLQSAVDGRLLGGTSAGAESSADWGWGTCGDVIESIQAGASFKCAERPPIDGEVGVLKVSAVTWGEFDERESKTCLDPERVKEALFIRPGDFLFSRANTIELVGACVIAKTVTKSLMLSDKILRLCLADRVLPEWLLICLRSRFGRSEIERLATGNQESMRNIGQERIKQIRLPLPAIAEQGHIVAEVERRLSIARGAEAEVETNLKRAHALRRVVLASTFGGGACS